MAQPVTKSVKKIAKTSDFKEAIKKLQPMRKFAQDFRNYIRALQMCIDRGDFIEGKLIHTRIKSNGIAEDKPVSDTLIRMYLKCGDAIQEAQKVFEKAKEKDILTYNFMIAAYTKHGLPSKALNLLGDMLGSHLFPDRYTFASVLPACTTFPLIQNIHGRMLKSGEKMDMFIQSAMVDMYGKVGSLKDARQVFDKMSSKDDVCWRIMISGYIQNGLAEEALKLYSTMRDRGVAPGVKTLTGVLAACGSVGALELGTRIHEEIVRENSRFDVFVESAIVDMYAKCGEVERARMVFDGMKKRDVVTWTCMILGYGNNGFAKEALELFYQMKDEGPSPNHVTLLAVLSACNNAGLVDDGFRIFDTMEDAFGIEPVGEHYRCMVSLLGRAGHLLEAYDFIQKMPLKPDAAIWRCLLMACRIHNNLELGEKIAKQLIEKDVLHDVPYVLLSNMLEANGKWADAEKVRKKMYKRSVKKTPGCSWVELGNVVHGFLADDRSHPQSSEVYALVDSLHRIIKEEGYVANGEFVLKDVDEEEQKEQILRYHSERLAVAFALLNAPPDSTIRVIKNLRICGDCHLAIKLISKTVGRAIVVRDASRYHHFKDGKCSCQDYW